MLCIEPYEVRPFLTTEKGSPRQASYRDCPGAPPASPGQEVAAVRETRRWHLQIRRTSSRLSLLVLVRDRINHVRGVNQRLGESLSLDRSWGQRQKRPVADTLLPLSLDKGAHPVHRRPGVVISGLELRSDLGGPARAVLCHHITTVWTWGDISSWGSKIVDRGHHGDWCAIRVRSTRQKSDLEGSAVVNAACDIS